MSRPIITDNKDGTINISAGELYSDNQVIDWAKPSIKLDQLHKRLDDCLNMKKHSEAFSILLEMQGEVLKLQQFVLYGVTGNTPPV